MYNSLFTAAVVSSFLRRRGGSAVAGYVPNNVNANKLEISKTVATGTPKPVLVTTASFAVQGANIDTEIWRSGSGARLSVIADGEVRLLLTHTPDGGTLQTHTLNSAVGFASLGERIKLIGVQEMGGQSRLHVGKAGGAMSLVESLTMPAAGHIDFKGYTLRLGYQHRVFDTTGIAFYELDALPTGFDPVADDTAFFDSQAYAADPAATASYLGAQPTEAKFGNAASWTALTNDGTGSAFTTTTGTGAFSDVAPPSFAITTHTDTALIDGSATQASLLSNDHVTALGATDYDYSTWSIAVDRASIVAGESVYAEVVGPSEDKKALWGLPVGFRHVGRVQEPFRPPLAHAPEEPRDRTSPDGGLGYVRHQDDKGPSHPASLDRAQRCDADDDRRKPRSGCGVLGQDLGDRP